MTDCKHTMGPWEACAPGDYADFDGKCSVILGDDMRIAIVQGVSDEDLANARLVASAPDLLAALESVVDLLDSPVNYCETRKIFEHAREVIEKATGGKHGQNI